MMANKIKIPDYISSEYIQESLNAHVVFLKSARRVMQKKMQLKTYFSLRDDNNSKSNQQNESNCKQLGEAFRISNH
jgi:hypothetical protein